MNKLVGIRAQAGSTSSEESSVPQVYTATFLGQEHLVVPVVAMIEGVRFGAAQSSGELGLASEFGKFPDGWNNRPCTTGHPKVPSDPEDPESPLVFTSAGSPQVVTTYGFGFIANTSLEDGKLKMEAWLNTARAAEIPAAQDAVDRINAGETVEVSVGFFCEVEGKPGKFKSQAYTGIWRNIVPDHLAILGVNDIGACSIEDGCGIPRVNQQLIDLEADTMPTVATPATPATTPLPEHPKPGTKPPPKAGTARTLSERVSEAVMRVFHDSSSSHSSPALIVDEAKDCGCGCGGTCGQPSIQQRKKEGSQLAIQSFIRQALASDLMSGDVLKALNKALIEETGVQPYDIFVLGYTPDYVIYMQYESGRGYCEYWRAFSIDNNAVVTFTGDPQKITIVMKIIPASSDGGATQGSSSSSGSGSGYVTAQERSEETTQTGESHVEEGQGQGLRQVEDPNMPQNPQTNTTTETPPAAGTETPPAPAAPASAAPAASTTPAVLQTQEVPAAKATATAATAPRQLSVQEYIEQAPPEMREVLQSSMRLHQEKRDGLISTIKANQANKFTEDWLKTQSTDVLEGLASLARVHTVDFSGRAPSQPLGGVQGMNQAPPPPTIFERSPTAVGNGTSGRELAAAQANARGTNRTV
jgi:hypothetical protein